MNNRTIPSPSIGRIVHYKLSSQDCNEINARRERLRAQEGGYQNAPGNHANPGDIYPAMIVRTWGDSTYSCVQLQVFLDGPDSFWGSSRSHRGEAEHGEGTFAWPTVDYSPVDTTTDPE